MRGISIYAAAALLLALIVSLHGFGQSINASVGGTVSDPSKALIPGVSVSATNTGTGIVNTTVTNESGAYQFPALQPGTYKLSAELPGFQTQAFTDVQLGGAQQVTLNFTMQVAAAAGQNVEVTVAADTVLATTSNSVGTILPEYRVRDLPALTGNTFNIVSNLPGVQRDGTGTFGYMAGGRLGDVNSTRDGINVNDGRYENGAWSTIFSPSDMVEEVKVIVAPVDAETSRGSGQVQMITRSGTNQYRGSAYWSNHNSAMDANDWFNNQKGLGNSFDNRNQYGVRVGGPIIKNKTFFFAFFTGQRDLKKVQATSLTYTDMAKAGIFRYFPGTAGNQPASGATPTVDLNGNPVRPSSATGALAAIGLFGTCNFNGAPVANCTPFNDPLRTSISSVPFLKQEFSRMPSPNYYGALTGSDGLNTAGINFVRVEQGLDLTNGNGDEVNRDQYNARIDHNFNSREKISLIGTQEHTWGAATQAGLRNWPNAFDGLAVKRPVVYTIQVTSTLSSSMLNQLRLGKSGSDNWQWGSSNRGDAIGAQSLALEPVANGIPFATAFASGIGPFNNIGGFGRWRVGINPRYSIGDDLSWTVRKHAFKVGYEYRRTESNGFNDQDNTPRAALGGGSSPSPLAGTLPGFSGLAAADSTLAKNIMYDLAGAVATQFQGFEPVSASMPQLVGTPTVPNNAHWNTQNEMSAYFKDDWKFRPDLTLNLGVHWEYYGQPYEHYGLAARVIGDESSFLNVSCASTPGTPLDPKVTNCTNLAQVQFVGKNSTHPNIGTYVNGDDYHSFAPSVGFAYNVPWWGKGKTVIRSGYGISYEGALRNFITVDGVINSVPGVAQIASGAGLPFVPANYTTLGTLGWPIPFPAGSATVAPFVVQPTQRSLAITTYDFVNPYTQNWNFEIQREVAKNTTVEVRYVGTKGSHLTSNVNLNSLAWLKTDGSTALYQAFNSVRAGGESPLLDQIFKGVALPGTCTGGTVTNGVTCTGATIVRTNTTLRGQIANGNFGTFLGDFNTATLQLTTGGDTNAGSVLRHAGLPDNYLVPDPQYSTVNVTGNNQNSTYNSLQLQVTRRLSRGFTNTTTYIYSKAMGAGAFVDPNNRADEKTLQAVDHKSQISSNGSYELPFGTDHFLLGGTPGWVQNIVSKWQLGGIMNYNTGAPLSLTSGITTISSFGARPQLVGAIPSGIGSVVKTAKGVNYFNGYTQIVDPGVSNVTSLQGLSGTAIYTNKAIVAPNGQTILVNPQPGQTGNLGQSTVRGPGFFDLDMNMVKRFKITESKTFEFRLDAINILNHPNFS
ncbi:MAG TPA: carboxypeptidase-like regulatory domain-containing protein, partial [Terriglobia bacterium]